MKVQGKITKILDKVQGTKKDGGSWVKISFLIETDETYNNLYCFEVFGDEKVENFEKYNKVGQVVDVEFNVKCNEWKGKYYTSLDAWKIFSADAKPKREIEVHDPEVIEREDDLPFL